MADDRRGPDAPADERPGEGVLQDEDRELSGPAVCDGPAGRLLCGLPLRVEHDAQVHIGLVADVCDACIQVRPEARIETVQSAGHADVLTAVPGEGEHYGRTALGARRGPFLGPDLHLGERGGRLGTVAGHQETPVGVPRPTGLQGPGDVLERLVVPRPPEVAAESRRNLGQRRRGLRRVGQQLPAGRPGGRPGGGRLGFLLDDQVGVGTEGTGRTHRGTTGPGVGTRLARPLVHSEDGAHERGRGGGGVGGARRGGGADRDDRVHRHAAHREGVTEDAGAAVRGGLVRSGRADGGAAHDGVDPVAVVQGRPERLQHRDRASTAGGGTHGGPDSDRPGQG